MDIEQLRANATSQDDRSVVLSRDFDAAPQEVFRAWTEPRLWAQWFAPEPMEVPRAEVDARPGGRYVFVMRDEDGNDYMSTGTYEVVDEPRKIVYTDSAEAMPGTFTDMLNEARGEAPGTPIPDGRATVTFEDMGGTTKMTFSEEFESQKTRDAWVQLQMVEGLDQGFDQLEKLLKRELVGR